VTAPDRQGRRAHSGQGALHVVTLPPSHTTASPPAHPVNTQPCAPALPAGHASTALAPSAAVAEQLPSKQLNWQVLPGPQAHVPFAHVPAHSVLASQLT
jgi:hypothetical protein